MTADNAYLDIDAVAHRHMRAEAQAEWDAYRPTDQDLARDDYERQEGRRG